MNDGDCNPLVCSPTGPGTPFGSASIILFDSIRLATILASLGLMLATGYAWARSVRRGGQRDRFLALALLSVVIIGTQIQNIGNTGSYRPLLSALGVFFAIRGLMRFRAEQPAKPGSRADDTED